MGSVCCIEKKDGHDDLYDARTGGNKKNIQAMNGMNGVHGPNPFKHRAGEGYEEMRAQKEREEMEQ